MSVITKYRMFIESFLKRNAPYINLLHIIAIIITGVLSLITLIGVIGIWPQLYSLIHKEPLVSMSTNCPVSIQHPNLDNYLSAKCAQLTNAETISLSKDNLSQYTSVPDGTLIGIRLEKQDINECRFVFSCNYTNVIGDTTQFTDLLSYCVLRINGTKSCFP